MAIATDHPLISVFFIVGFALPSFVVSIGEWGWRGLRVWLLLGVYALLIETVAVKTGFPYGGFVYGADIGFKLFDAVPWTVPFAWIPLVLATLTLSRRWLVPRWLQIVSSALLLMFIDMLLDPAAVALHFWTWNDSSGFYAVPWTNFLGWLLTGAIGSAIAVTLLPTQRPWPRSLLYSLRLILVFWTLAALGLKLWLPALIGLILLIAERYSKPDRSSAARQRFR